MTPDRRIAFERFSAAMLIALVNMEALERNGHPKIARRYLSATIRLRALEFGAAVLGERYCTTLRLTIRLARRTWSRVFNQADPILAALPADRLPDLSDADRTT